MFRPSPHPIFASFSVQRHQRFVRLFTPRFDPDLCQSLGSMKLKKPVGLQSMALHAITLHGREWASRGITRALPPCRHDDSFLKHLFASHRFCLTLQMPVHSSTLPLPSGRHSFCWHHTCILLSTRSWIHFQQSYRLLQCYTIFNNLTSECKDGVAFEIYWSEHNILLQQM